MGVEQKGGFKSEEERQAAEDFASKRPGEEGYVEDVDMTREMAEAGKPLRVSALAFRKVASDIRELVEKNKEVFPGLQEQLTPVAELYEREAEHQDKYAVNNAEYSRKLYDKGVGRKE